MTSGIPVSRIADGAGQATISPDLRLCACFMVQGVIEMCQPCWDAIPHRQSFDICAKCLTQCDAFDWSDYYA